jgi:poly(3-hydroxybutyrate) depolymerase
MNLFTRFNSLSTRIVVTLMLTGCASVAAPIPVGSSEIEVGTGTNAITVYTYKPATYSNGPVLFVFHGMLRNAKDYRDFGIVMAQRFNCMIAAPLFDTNRFPGEAYKGGGLLKHGEHGAMQEKSKWTYSLVPKVVEEVRAREGKPALPYYFIGHSAGGQFLMRMAAFSPLEAKRIVAANPGSDLFPRRDWKFGYGFGGLPEEYSDDKQLQAYLAAPLTLYLGTADIDPNHFELDKSAAAELEGPYRLARGRACFEYAKNLAAEHGWKFNWRKVETPGIAHDGKGMFAAKDVADALFGAERLALK